MKRFACFLLAAAVCLGTFAGCGKNGENDEAVTKAEYSAPVGGAEISRLSICLPPDTDKAEALGTDGECGACVAFGDALKTRLAEQGYNVENIDFSIGTSDTAVCEGLADGSIDLSFIPANRYTTYTDSVDVILAATQSKLSCDGTVAKKWNGSENAPQKTEEQVPYGRTLICATSSEYGKKLAEIVNSGKKPTFDQLSQASWAVLKTDTSSSFIYPDLWLSANYSKTTADLPNIISLDGYSALFTLAAQEKIDVIVIASDQRMAYSDCWNMEDSHLDMTGKVGLGRSDSIFDAINVIGATEPIYGDAVAVTKANSEIYNDGFLAALKTALMAMSDTDEGEALYALCGYTGFAEADSGDYGNISGLSLTGEVN